MTPEANTRYWVNIAHEHCSRCQSSVEHALSKIDDAGWHPDSLPMRHLWNDAVILRQLAEKLEAKLQQLLKPQETNP